MIGRKIGNSIWSMPFICGSKLYLYDIKEDEKYLLWNQKGILQEFGTEMCFNGENVLVFAGRGMGGQPSDTVMIALDGSKKKITIVLGNINSDIVHGKKLLAIVFSTAVYPQGIRLCILET